jgi:hypothetical protein
MLNILKQLFFYFFAALTLLVSCSKHDKPQPNYTHTVVLYFPWSGTKSGASGSLYSEFLLNIESIKRAIVKEKGTGTTRVMMILATSATQGKLCEIVYSGGTCTEKALKQYSEWSFTEKANIAAMFSDVADYAQTPTYSMLIGSHGMGWLPRESRPDKGYAFGGVTPEMKTNIDELDSAIAESGIKHLEYLCFDDCYMANIETAYQLRHTTDFLIASTSEIMKIGLPYADIWTYMKSTAPDYHAIVDKFSAFYSSYTFPYGALSVIDCRQTERAASLMRQLNMMMTAAGVNPSDITAQALDGFTSHVFFDMKDYTDGAIKAVAAPTSLSEAFKELYADMIPAHTCTPNLYSVYLQANVFPVSANCGLTISDPTVNRQATPYH